MTLDKGLSTVINIEKYAILIITSNETEYRASLNQNSLGCKEILKKNIIQTHVPRVKNYI